jgi:hypothetical protein
VWHLLSSIESLRALKNACMRTTSPHLDIGRGRAGASSHGWCVLGGREERRACGGGRFHIRCDTL